MQDKIIKALIDDGLLGSITEVVTFETLGGRYLCTLSDDREYTIIPNGELPQIVLGLLKDEINNNAMGIYDSLIDYGSLVDYILTNGEEHYYITPFGEYKQLGEFRVYRTK